MKNIFKPLIVAFSIYSKIPMPVFEWDSKDMRYHLLFFPLVGLVIGLLEYLWYHFFYSESLLYACIAIVIPILITGGFHLDGFLDTQDALHSYGSREKKLEILKDPHVGAFAIISLVVYILLALGFVSKMREDILLCACSSFFFSRVCSALSVTYFPKSKKEGMLVTSSKNEDKKMVGRVLIAQAILGSAILLYINTMTALLELVTLFLVFIYYYYKSKKEFGGISGDLAGWFVCICELTILIVLVI